MFQRSSAPPSATFAESEGGMAQAISADARRDWDGALAIWAGYAHAGNGVGEAVP